MQDMIKDGTEKPRAFGGAPEVKPDLDEEGNELPTEDEQLDYDMLVVRARKMMYGKGRESVLKLLGSSEMPSKGMGQAGAMLIKTLVQSAKEQGREISPDAAISAGEEIIEDLNELAKANNVYEYESQEDEISEMQDAMLWGVKFYGDGTLQAGEVTPEMKQQASQFMKQGLEQERTNAEQSHPQKKPVAQAVSQAVNQPGGGIINSAMQGGA